MRQVGGFHGWSRTDMSSHGEKRPALHIGRIPGRKQVAIYQANGDLVVLAWFRNEEAAITAMNMIDWLVGLTPLGAQSGQAEKVRESK